MISNHRRIWLVILLYVNCLMCISASTAKSSIHNNPSIESNTFLFRNANINNPIQKYNIIIRGGGSDGRSVVWSSSNSSLQKRHPSSSYQYSNNPFTNSDNYTRNNHKNHLEDSNNVQTKEAMNAFLSRDSRKTFVTRVYAILTAQLLFTSFVTIAMNIHRDKVLYYLMNTGRLGRMIPLLSMALSTVAWYTIALSERARHETPLKWQMLSLFTIGESVIVGIIGCFYSFRTLILAMGCTGIATSAITSYTLLQKNPKYDLTQWGAGLFSAGLIFLVVGLIQLFFPGFLRVNQMMYSAMGASLFSMYLAYHTRLIIGGKHAKYRMNENDYVFAAMACKFFVILLHVNTSFSYLLVYSIWGCHQYFHSFTGTSCRRSLKQALEEI